MHERIVQQAFAMPVAVLVYATIFQKISLSLHFHSKGVEMFLKI